MKKEIVIVDEDHRILIDRERGKDSIEPFIVLIPQKKGLFWHNYHCTDYCQGFKYDYEVCPALYEYEKELKELISYLPEKENELPENLKTLLYNGYFELLWVKENTYSFKKMLPTMEKYPDVPIITADDGCVYYRNYAEMLYKIWQKDSKCVVSFNGFHRLGITNGGGGSGILFPPGCFKNYKLTQAIIDTKHDDYYYGCLSKINNIDWIILNDIPKNTNFVEIVPAHRDVNSISRNFHINNYEEENKLCNIIKSELSLS